MGVDSIPVVIFECQGLGEAGVGMAEGREELLGKKHKALVVENCEQSQLADPERYGDPESRATPRTKWQNDPFFTFQTALSKPLGPRKPLPSHRRRSSYWVRLVKYFGISHFAFATGLIQRYLWLETDAHMKRVLSV